MNIHERFIENRKEKDKKWDDLKEIIDALADKLGKGVDESIKETIVALKLLGIHTTASCEGHLDHGTFAPYIDIEATDALEKEKLLDSMSNAAEIEAAKKEIRHANLKERWKLIQLLDEFYTDRQSPFDKRLTINKGPFGRSRLESLGAALQIITDLPLKSQRLLQYQQEMKAFSEFLKEKYFNSTTEYFKKED